MTARAEYDRWKLEHQQLEEALTRIADAERAALAVYGCPTNPVLIDDFLKDHKRMDEEHRRRIKFALHVLLKIDEVRRYTAIGHENARLAAYAALAVGALTNDKAAREVRRLTLKTRAEKRHGGQARGRQLTREAQARAHAHDAELLTYMKRWKTSDELQEDYPSLTSYLIKRMKLSRRTVERRLAALKATK